MTPRIPGIAFHPFPTHICRMRLAVYVTAACATWLGGIRTLPAQDVPIPAPAPAAPPVPAGPEGGQPERPDGGGDDREHHRGGPKPGPSGFGGGFSRGDRDRGDMFRGLPEAERQRVREAFEKAWQDPEVNAARDRLTKANEEFRMALHLALKKVDPEVVKILDRVRPPGGSPGGARMPDPQAPDFARQSASRLAGELQMWARMDRRDGSMVPMHDRIMQVAAVKEAFERADAASPEMRPESWRRLREAYLSAAKAEYIKTYGKPPWDPSRERERGMGGPGGPGPGGPGPGPGGDRGDRPPPPPAPRPPEAGGQPPPKPE